MRPDAHTGVDVGSVRVGIARTDASALLAVPVQTVSRGDGDLERIAAIVREFEAVEVVVGLPVGLDGREGRAARVARELAVALRRVVDPVPIRLVDERMSTVTASQQLRQAGRSSRSSRPVVDQAAAVVILQYAVDTERATGRAPGIPLEG